MEIVCTTSIIQSEAECLHFRLNSPNIISQLPYFSKFTAVYHGNTGYNNWQHISTASIKSEATPVFFMESVIDLQHRNKERGRSRQRSIDRTLNMQQCRSGIRVTSIWSKRKGQAVVCMNGKRATEDCFSGSRSSIPSRADHAPEKGREVVP